MRPSHQQKQNSALSLFTVAGLTSDVGVEQIVDGTTADAGRQIRGGPQPLHGLCVDLLRPRLLVYVGHGARPRPLGNHVAAHPKERQELSNEISVPGAAGEAPIWLTSSDAGKMHMRWMTAWACSQAAPPF